MQGQMSFGIQSNDHDTWIEPELELPPAPSGDELEGCSCLVWPEVTYCHECKHDCRCHRVPTVVIECPHFQTARLRRRCVFCAQ
jgi:hypothetical protein